MQRVEGVNSAHTAFTKELNHETINTMVHTFFAAEFTMVVSEHPPAFKLDGLFEVSLVFIIHP